VNKLNGDDDDNKQRGQELCWWLGVAVTLR